MFEIKEINIPYLFNFLLKNHGILFFRYGNVFQPFLNKKFYS
jgi:hypothetical protein